MLNSFSQVRESAVIGIPDEMKGEKVAAIVVPDGDLNTSDLKKYCQANLTNYRVPTRFELIGELPRNSMITYRLESGRLL